MKLRQSQGTNDAVQFRYNYYNSCFVLGKSGLTFCADGWYIRDFRQFLQANSLTLEYSFQWLSLSRACISKLSLNNVAEWAFLKNKHYNQFSEIVVPIGYIVLYRRSILIYTSVIFLLPYLGDTCGAGERGPAPHPASREAPECTTHSCIPWRDALKQPQWATTLHLPARVPSSNCRLSLKVMSSSVVMRGMPEGDVIQHRDASGVMSCADACAIGFSLKKETET